MAIMVKPIATMNTGIYPAMAMLVSDCDAFYSVFADGESLEMYILENLLRQNQTELMLDSAIRRSLDTVIYTAPKQFMQELKKAINTSRKGELYVVPNTLTEQVGTLTTGDTTAAILEYLWNSHDWSQQEIAETLGLSYNPGQGKKERLIIKEIEGDRHITAMNRLHVTERLINAANLTGETVQHISDWLDAREKEETKNVLANVESGSDTV